MSIASVKQLRVVHVLLLNFQRIIKFIHVRSTVHYAHQLQE